MERSTSFTKKGTTTSSSSTLRRRSDALDLLDAAGAHGRVLLVETLPLARRARTVRGWSTSLPAAATDRRSVLGSQFLEDLAGFFILFQTMRDGFVARAEAVSRLIHDVRTTFVVVTTLEGVPPSTPNSSSRAFASAASSRPARLQQGAAGAVLRAPRRANCRALGGRRRAGHLARRLSAERRGFRHRPSAELVGRVLAEVARSLANFRLVATREAELLRELSAGAEMTATVPYHPGT